MHPFRPGREGYVARLDAEERRIVAGVVADVAELLGHPVTAPMDEDWPVLGEDDDGAVVPPLDPALARLLPAASEDHELAAELRRLTEREVRWAKAERLRTVWHELQRPGGRLVVAAEDAMAWAGALTDVRLVLSERLGVDDSDDAEHAYRVASGDETEDEVTTALATVYSALSWFQESLVTAMLGEMPESGADG